MCERPTWRTFMKERRQSWSALWWSLWKTSGCSSSKIASTLLKNVMWFCCRNSCMFRWMRPCKRPATMGRCLKKRKRQNSQEVEPSPMATKKILYFIYFFTWAKGPGATQPSSYMRGWHQTRGSRQTSSLLYQQAVWRGDAPGRRAERDTWKKHKICVNS